MKNSYRTFSPAIIAAALALLAAAPPPASAQAVGGYMRGGAISRPGGSMPAPNQAPSQAPQFSQPMRSGAIFGRPGGSFGPSPTYSQPTFNQPNFNRPVFSQPSYGGQTYGNVQGYGQTYGGGQSYNGLPYGAGQVYGNAPAYGNSQSYGDRWPSGPVVTLPDAAEGRSYGGYNRIRPGRFSGSQAGSPGLSGYPFSTRGGSTLSGDFRPIRPTGSGRGAAGYGADGTDLRITTPRGPQFVPPSVYQNTYVYNNYNNSNNSATIVAPPLLGGYYYGNYCDTFVSAATYPSIYSAYAGFPQYIFNSTPNVIIVGQPMYQPYVTPYLPFDTPNYSVTYNQNNYYVASQDRVREIEGGGAPARAAIKSAYPADSYQAAFADIAKAWTEGDIAPLKKHVRDSDTRISVFLNKKYSYSIASGDFAQITRDALDRLHTVSFDLTRLRKSKTGDVTAYGTHVYRTGAAASPAGDTATVPFDQNGADPDNVGASPYDKSGDPAAGVNKTVYVSYTLRHRDGQWYIVEVDSSDRDLVPTS